MRKAMLGLSLVALTAPLSICGCANSTTNTVGGGWMSVGSWFAPKPVSEGLAPGGKAGVASFVASAAMHEQSGNIAAARQNYELALKSSPNDLEALMGYAHLLDRQNELGSATKYYKIAAKKHPKEPRTHNDLGLCLARQNKLDEAAKSLKEAVKLRPDQPRYRNNLASVLVEQGKNDAALSELTVVHGEAVAHYNLACLLQQRSKFKEADQHLAKAIAISPALAADLVAQNKLPITTAEQYRSPDFNAGGRPRMAGTTVAPPLQDTASYTQGNVTYTQVANYPGARPLPPATQMSPAAAPPAVARQPAPTLTPGLAQPSGSLGLNAPNNGPAAAAPAPASAPPYLGAASGGSSTVASGVRYPTQSVPPSTELGGVAPRPQGSLKANGVEALPPIEPASYNGPYRR